MRAFLFPARTIRQPRRLDLRVVLGLVLAFVAAGGGNIVWDSATDTRGVLVATRDLPSGTVLRAGDLAVAQVQFDDALYAAALPAMEQSALVGRQLAAPVHARQVLVRAQLASGLLLGPDHLALTIAVRSETAAGGQLRPGDSVRVFVTKNKGKADSSTSVVLERVTIYAIGYDERLTTINSGGAADTETKRAPLVSLTLIVTTDQVLKLANAKWNGDLDVALLPSISAMPASTPVGSR